MSVLVTQSSRVSDMMVTQWDCVSDTMTVLVTKADSVYDMMKA